MKDDDDLEYKPKELPKLTRWLLYLLLAFAMYNCFSIVALGLVAESVNDFFDPNGANRQILTFLIADGIALFISWGSGIVIHKDDDGRTVEITKERSKNFTRYIYYSSVVMLLIVLIASIHVIFR